MARVRGLGFFFGGVLFFIIIVLFGSFEFSGFIKGVRFFLKMIIEFLDKYGMLLEG